MNLLRFILARGLHRTSLEIALDLIYAATELSFPIDKILLGTPSVVDVREDITTDPNTFVPVLNVQEVFDARYKPLLDDGILYRRIPLNWLTADADVLLIPPRSYPYTTYDLLDQINAKLHTQLTKQDVLDEVHTSLKFSLRLRANHESLVWVDDITIVFDGFSRGRLTEDDNIRATEDGMVRDLEDATFE